MTKNMLAKTDQMLKLVQDIDQCVMCGLCLPHCPTYTVTKNEAESPRGRIALVRALYENKINATPKTVAHLDHCLGCNSCETACPANVNYEEIIDLGRTLIAEKHSLAYKIKLKLVTTIITNPFISYFVNKIIRILKIVKLELLFNRFYLFRIFPTWEKMVFPEIEEPISPKFRILLFDACASSFVDDSTINAANYLLRKLGCKVIQIPSSICCGALHQHTGKSNKADNFRHQLADLVKEYDFDYLVSMATGCGAQLKQQKAFEGKHLDINDLMLQLLEKESLEFQPLSEEVFIHQPCTSSFSSIDNSTVKKLLQIIPKATFKEFDDTLSCCGAGGINVVMQQTMAETLIQPKLNALKASNSHYLVTSNIGCALHFQQQIKQQKLPITVCHPINLLAQQLL